MTEINPVVCVWRSGNYTATYNSGTADWSIADENGREVGRMFGPKDAHGRNRYACGGVTCSMSALVWAGDLPTGHASPKSEHYGIHFDTGPLPGFQAALDDFAKRADRLRAWRAANASERYRPVPGKFTFDLSYGAPAKIVGYETISGAPVAEYVKVQRAGSYRAVVSIPLSCIRPLTDEERKEIAINCDLGFW